MKITRKLIIVALLLYLGIGFAIADVAYGKYIDSRKISEYIENSSGSEPVKIFIPRLHLVKDIEPGLYDFSNKVWDVSKSNPNFAVISEKPNADKGVTAVYAHNTNDLFKEINLLGEQDLVTIETASGDTFVYQFSHSKLVAPDDTSVFSNSGNPTLVLITCEGKNNSLRRLVFFRLISNS